MADEEAKPDKPKKAEKAEGGKPEDEAAQKEGGKALGAGREVVKCGIVMPISPTLEYPGDHWNEVLSIMTDALQASKTYDFEVQLVSEADEVGLILHRIVTNLYSNDLILVDVSSRNPNVFFELGMRLAFDKPIVIVKDDATDFAFDAQVIEHLPYPKDLRFKQIVAFKEKLRLKAERTYQAFKADRDKASYLKSFGNIKVSHLEQTELSEGEAILDSIDTLRSEVRRLSSIVRKPTEWIEDSPHWSSSAFLLSVEVARITPTVASYISGKSSYSYTALKQHVESTLGAKVEDAVLQLAVQRAQLKL